MMETEERDRIFLAIYTPLKPLVVSWVAMVVLASTVYVLEASSPSLGQSNWMDAARAGSSLWMLALGAPMKVGAAIITLPPLFFTLLIAWAMYRELRSSLIVEWKYLAISSASALFGTAILGIFSLHGTIRPVGAVCAAAGTFLLGAWARFKVEPPNIPLWNVVQQAWDLLRPVLKALVIAALLMVIAALFFHRERVGAINSAYVLDTKSTLGFALAQFIYAPTYVIWALGYLVGSGFAVGSGTSFSPFGVHTEPLPAIPVLGALPGPDSSAPWLPFLVTLVLFAWGVRKSRNFNGGRKALAVACAIFILVLALGVIFGLFAGGSIGQGRMHKVGTEVGSTILAYALVIGGGFAGGIFAPFAFRWLKRDLLGTPSVSAMEASSDSPARVPSESAEDISCDPVADTSFDSAPGASLERIRDTLSSSAHQKDRTRHSSQEEESEKEKEEAPSGISLGERINLDGQPRISLDKEESNGVKFDIPDEGNGKNKENKSAKEES